MYETYLIPIEVELKTDEESVDSNHKSYTKKVPKMGTMREGNVVKEYSQGSFHAIKIAV